MFEKSPKSYTDLLGKTNRIVEGTTIQGDIISPADFRLDGHLVGNFQSKGKIVIGPAGSVKGDIICNLFLYFCFRDILVIFPYVPQLVD